VLGHDPERSTASAQHAAAQRQLYEITFHVCLIRMRGMPILRRVFQAGHRGTSIEVLGGGSTEVTIMRKRYRVLVLAVLAAAVAVPLGFALSPESTPTRTVAVQSQSPDAGEIGKIGIVAAASTKTHLALVQTAAPARSGLPALPDGAKLLFVGSALFGLAGVMRRTN
jgi:hypothetical protein